MASTPISCVAVAVLLLLVGLAYSVTQQPAQVKNCRAAIDDFNKLQFIEIKKCADKLGYTTTKEKLKKSACLLKCAMQAAGVMNQDGSVTEAKLNQYISTHFPATLQQRARTTFTPCLALVQPNSAAAAAKDPFCKSHEAFVKCMSRNFLQFCRGQ